MSLDYPIQISQLAIGSGDLPVILSANYADNSKDIETGGMVQMIFYIAYTPAEAGRTLTILIEGGPSTDDVYKNPYSEFDNDKETLTIKDIDFVGTTDGVTYKFRYPLPVADKAVRISVKENAVSLFGNIKIKYIISGK